ncbi:MAG: hypothetical protein IT457_08655 [Planctomycetes bacterium]|nr:hypothetical protein [Planctomycetota bacterium]
MLALVAALAATMGWDSIREGHGSALAGPSLAAMPLDPLSDADGDLLPDRLEWVVLTDPQLADTDGDGVDDFLATVQFRRPFDPPGLPRATDDEMRIVVSSTCDASGESSIWVHFLFRFVGTSASELRSIEPYLDVWGTRYPIAGLLTAGRVDLRTRFDAQEGLFCLASFELASESSLRALMPCTLGATAIVGTRAIHSGAYVQDTAGFVTLLVGADDNKGLLQPLEPMSVDDPFWTSSRVCVMQLEVISSTGAGAMCEVRNAECMSSGRLACPPTCLQSRGRTMFFPNGLSTVTGGGR